MRAGDWFVGLMVVMGSLSLLVAVLGVVDAAYHHWAEEHMVPKQETRREWPPRIVQVPGCATWDEIRKECDDD